MIESDINLMDYLTQIAGSGCVPIRLSPETKAPTETFGRAKQRYQRSLNTLEAANLMLEWIASGFGAGFLLTSDFWVLDCDSQEAIDWVEEYLYRNGIECPRVKTPHGFHYYFRVPPGLRSENLKHH
ncbi:MAG: bifunctional DNA primase/polymerase, partial [Verrucomicrobiota bacterium]